VVRQVGGQPASELFAKRFLLGRVREVHGGDLRRKCTAALLGLCSGPTRRMTWLWAGPSAEPVTRGDTMKVVDAIAEILKRERIEFLSAYPTTPIIDSAAAVGIRPDQVGEVMRRAFNLLKMGRPGPVMVEVPADVAVADIGDGALSYKPVKATAPAGNARDVEAAARALLAAERPVIHAGQGVLYAEACAALQELAELVQAPVMTTTEGKGAFPEDHP